MYVEIKIREVRERQNVSLLELSKRTKISKSHLSNIERGKKEPSLSIMVKIALALKVNIQKLYKTNF